MEMESSFPTRCVSAIQLRASEAGGFGSNLGEPIGRQIRAETDLEAILLWLANYVESPLTHTSYRREVDRLLLWTLAEALKPGAIAEDDLRLVSVFLAAPDRSNPLWTVFAELKPVSSLTHEDLKLYLQFLVDPQPSSTWITERGANPSGPRYSMDNPRWRPFAGKLKLDSVRYAFVILGSMFGWLVESGYLRGNPLGLLRQHRPRPAPHITRYLPAVMWQHVKDYIAAMPEGARTQQLENSRARWLTTLFYLTGLRISEVAAGTMGNFLQEKGTDGTSRWWLEVVGKGLKYRRIPVSEELLVELMRYRQAHGLEPLPARNELLPVLLPFRRRARNVAGEGVNPATVHHAIKKIFEQAAEWTEALGGEYVEHAAHIREASAHWLRHTAASNMLDNKLDLRTVRDNLGHSSFDTISRYAYEGDDRRHDETTQSHRMNWR